MGWKVSLSIVEKARYKFLSSGHAITANISFNVRRFA